MIARRQLRTRGPVELGSRRDASRATFRASVACGLIRTPTRLVACLFVTASAGPGLPVTGTVPSRHSRAHLTCPSGTTSSRCSAGRPAAARTHVTAHVDRPECQASLGAGPNRQGRSVRPRHEFMYAFRRDARVLALSPSGSHRPTGPPQARNDTGTPDPRDIWCVFWPAGHSTCSRG